MSQSDEEMDCSEDVCDDDDNGYDNDDVRDIVADEIKEEQSRIDGAHAEFYKCLTAEQVDKMLNESIELLCNNAAVTPSLAKVMLHAFHWDAQELIKQYKENPENVAVLCKVSPGTLISHNSICNQLSNVCGVCANECSSDRCSKLACEHSFCDICWARYFEVQIQQGASTGISCMASNCEIRAPEDFVLRLVINPALRERYQQFCFNDYVKSQPTLRFCPGPNCQVIIYSKVPKGVQINCKSCSTQWCFHCSAPPHAPADCSLIKKWLTKCADDSETANYISANTKDCPECHVCIEKNGGCNHMQCCNCRHDFCWMCLGEWRTHGSEYYECSKYRENPNVSLDSQHAKAREALKKYLHYYERWENHAKSLRLEEQTLANLKTRIDQKVSNGSGTWIDWQLLLEGAAVLARCRYTLQYTYPYAYYMKADNSKVLFEYRQAKLEAAIENLSWTIERAETTDKGVLQNQMHIAETMRTILLMNDKNNSE